MSRAGELRSPPRPIDVVLCSVCDQLSLNLYLSEVRADVLLVRHCPECDAGHCPRCGRHTATTGAACRDRHCTECGASLALTT